MRWIRYDVHQLCNIQLDFRRVFLLVRENLRTGPEEVSGDTLGET